MIIKVQADDFKDRFLVEAAFIRWVEQVDNKDFVILEIYIVADQTKKAGSLSVATTSIEEEPSLRLRINHGDRVYIMNNDGKTIDSKRIDLPEPEWVCPICSHRNLPSEKTCTGSEMGDGRCRCAKPKEAE